MDIEEIVRKRAALESEILSAIRKYEEETGTEVDDVYLTKVKTVSKRLQETVSVRVEACF